MKSIPVLCLFVALSLISCSEKEGREHKKTMNDPDEKKVIQDAGIQALTVQILAAWSKLDPPFRIVTSNEGEEPDLLDKEFSHRPRIDNVKSDFLDQAPDGYGSALSFFADEAFRYYIAAYMVAELTDGLEQSDVVFALTFGLDDSSYSEKVNPLRFGEQRWIDHSTSKFSMFDSAQLSSIIAFLENRSRVDEFSAPSINQALNRYWRPRLKEIQKAQPQR